MKKPINILIADDHPVYLDGLANGLNHLDTTGDKPLLIQNTFANGKEVINFLQESTDATDVILLDIEMPVMNGLATAKVINKEYPSLEVLILTTHDDPSLMLQFYEIQAAGYILKDASLQKIYEAIQIVNDGGSYYEKSVLDKIHLEIKKRSETPIVQLSPREQEILDLIAQQYTTTGIARILEIAPETVKDYRKNLLRKFDADNSIGLIIKAIQQQFIDPGEIVE